jgi:glutathione synthase/RimK-type ligase-like ATP-grasp enzyme
MNRPDDIRVMFDKPTCHALFEAHGVPCPPGLGTPRGYDDLRQRMVRAGMRRVFVKLAHGSSASGVVALETDGRRVQATTTVEAVDSGCGLRLYNTRAVRRLTDECRVAAVIDALCRERAHAEQWVPKASLAGGPFDLRVVVIGGRAMHAVARVGRSPMTNLHLRSRRADPGLVRSRMTPGAWDRVLRSCERAAGVVPESLYAGIDVVISPGFRRHAVLEINAFGDLLPGVLFEGLDAYAAELAALGVTAGGGPH